VIALQQKRYFGYRARTMLQTMAPSALVALGTAAAGAALTALIPDTLPPLARLLIMLAPLAAVWYLLLRATRHELVGEVHRLGAPIRARLALLRPNV
jgi:hypothetical protein